MTKNKLKLNDDKTHKMSPHEVKQNYFTPTLSPLLFVMALPTFCSRLTCAQNPGFMISDNMTLDKHI